MSALRAWNPKALLAGGLLLVSVGAVWVGAWLVRVVGAVPPATVAYAAPFPARVVAQQTVTVEGGEVLVKDAAPLCKGKTQDGTDCRRKTRDASGYCKAHRNQDPKAPKPKEPSKLPKGK